MKRLFEFNCNSCNKTFERLVRDDVTSGVICKHCDSTDTQRKISATKGFQFKGTGFYETDFK